MKKILIVLITFFGIVSCTNGSYSNDVTSNVQSISSLVSSNVSSENSMFFSSSSSKNSSLINESSSSNSVISSYDSISSLSSVEEISTNVSSNVSSVSSYSNSSSFSSSKVSTSSSYKPQVSSSSNNKVETYNPDGTVKLPIPTYSINSTWGQSGKFYEIDNSFPEGFSCIYGKQIVNNPDYYANTGNWKITYPNTGTRMGFQSPLFEEDLKLEVWFTINEIHRNNDTLDKTNPWIRIYGYSKDGRLVRTKDIESPTNFNERDYHYAFNGEGINYFELRFMSQPHEGTKCYNFGISKIGVKSFPYAYND